MTRFFIALFLCATLAGVVPELLRHWNRIEAVPSFQFEILIFLTFSTALIYRYLFKSTKPDTFILLYLLTMVIKLLAYGVFVLWIILEDRLGAVQNVVFFMVVYGVFTFLEIGFLYRKIGQKRPS